MREGVIKAITLPWGLTSITGGETPEGKLQRVSWEQALDETGKNLLQIKEKYGARAVGFGVGMPKGLEHFVLIRLANIFGSPNVIASQDVCHAPREITGVHTCGFYPVADLHNSTGLILSSNEEGQIVSMALDQLKKGTRMIVVDPRRTELASRADLWLQLKPGTETALALGLLNVVIEELLYDKEFVEKYTYGFEYLAREMKKYSPEVVSEITWVPADLIRQASLPIGGLRN